MKQKFSTSWKGSRQPRKQRKYLANAPIFVKRKIMSANLSKELRKKYGKRSFPVRKGDEVKIMVGKYRKKQGKISLVNTRKSKVAIENIQTKKKDGTKVNIWFDASNLQIQEIDLNDKKRLEALNRKATQAKPTDKKENKKEKTKNKIKDAKKSKIFGTSSSPKQDSELKESKNA